MRQLVQEIIVNSDGIEIALNSDGLGDFARSLCVPESDLKVA